MEHGTDLAYRKFKCRCPVCRAGKATRNRLSWERMKAKAQASPELIPHGTGSGYRNWGCRCGLCTKRAVREVKHWQATGTMVLEES